MARIPVLTPREKDLIQDVLDKVRTLRINTSLHSQNQGGHQAPEVYIAKVQEQGTSPIGIPEVTLGAPDTAGTAVCDVYGIVENGSDRELTAVTGFSKQEVLCISEDGAPLEDYILVVRTKGGRWIAVPTTHSNRIGKLKGALKNGQEADLDVYGWNGSSWADLNYDITVDPKLVGYLSTGSWTEVRYHRGLWIVTGDKGLHIEGLATSSVAKDALVTINIHRMVGGSFTSTGDSVQARALAATVANERIAARWDPRELWVAGCTWT